MSTTATIGLTLLGFVVGYFIAAYFSQSRVRKLAASHSARINALQTDLDTRTDELADARSQLEAEQAARKLELETEQAARKLELEAEQAARKLELEAAHGDASNLTAQLNIVRAQLEEFQSEAGELEDRLNAAEAHILSSDAEMAQNRNDISQWTGAYAQLKATYSRLWAEHREIEERRQQLEDDLALRRSEMEELSQRLATLQSAQALQLEVSAVDPDQTMTVITLARAEAEAARQRSEAELTEVRSRLSAMRYSVNVLTAAGAELAAQVASQNVIDLGDEFAALPDAVKAPAAAPLDAETAREELADLRGVITDWFGALRGSLPYDDATLQAFGGESATSRLAASATIDAASERIDLIPDGGAPSAGDDFAGEPVYDVAHTAGEEIPHAVMLAAIKAVTTTRIERGAARQIALARELAERQDQLSRLDERIHAWRTMLQVTLAQEPELLALLDEPRATSSGDMLSACATVALTAYQKKQIAQGRTAGETPSSGASLPGATMPDATMPDGPRRLAASGAPQPLALREWRPVRRGR